MKYDLTFHSGRSGARPNAQTVYGAGATGMLSAFDDILPRGRVHEPLHRGTSIFGLTAPAWKPRHVTRKLKLSNSAIESHLFDNRVDAIEDMIRGLIKEIRPPP